MRVMEPSAGRKLSPDAERGLPSAPLALSVMFARPSESTFLSSLDQFLRLSQLLSR